MAEPIPIKVELYLKAFDNWLENRDKPVARDLLGACAYEMIRDLPPRPPHGWAKSNLKIKFPMVTAMIDILKEDYED